MVSILAASAKSIGIAKTDLETVFRHARDGTLGCISDCPAAPISVRGLLRSLSLQTLMRNVVTTVSRTSRL